MIAERASSNAGAPDPDNLLPMRPAAHRRSTNRETLRSVTAL
jgi:hypothetical protein